MKQIFIMWYEESASQKENRLFIDPRFCLMTKDEVKSYVEEYNDTHSDNYRYYNIPQLWQRTKPDGNEESISNIDRFMKNYYLHYDRFELSYYHLDNVKANDEITEYIGVTTRNRFKKQYYDLINFIRNTLNGRIIRIAVHQDDISADTVTISIDIDGQIHNIIMKRADVT